MIRRYKAGNDVVEIKKGQDFDLVWRFRIGTARIDREWTEYTEDDFDDTWVELTKLDMLLIGTEDDDV
jgi:hypothetical protein